IFQVRPPDSRRSMIVGTYRTGDARYGPRPCLSGTQDGTRIVPDPCVFGSFHVASDCESQPHPKNCPKPAGGLSPVKPSRFADTSSRCAPQEEGVYSWNVRSETANVSASFASVGMRSGASCSRQA